MVLLDGEVTQHATTPEETWCRAIPDDEWEIYRRVIVGMRDAAVPFSLGGAFALATFAGHWRSTKDLDLYVREEDGDRTIGVMSALGLRDYYEVHPYDRGWIYRAHTNSTIIDAIWAMANRRTVVDDRWLFGGPEIVIRGERVRIVPAEEMIWGKLYVIQRPRCDWPDIINMIYGAGLELDWEHLFRRIGDDLPLLTAVMSTFVWMCPGRASRLPMWIWERLHLPTPSDGPEFIRRHVELLETRPWFGPLEEQKLAEPKKAA